MATKILSLAKINNGYIIIVPDAQGVEHETFIDTKENIPSFVSQAVVEVEEVIERAKQGSPQPVPDIVKPGLTPKDYARGLNRGRR